MKNLLSIGIMLLLAFPLFAEDKKEDLVMSEKKCISVFKEVLVDMKNKAIEKVFSKILDGGASSFKIMTDKNIAHIKKEDAGDFIGKNFKNYDLILKNFDKIKFSKFEIDMKNRLFKIKKDGEVLGSERVYIIPIEIPVLKDNKDNKVGFDGREIYSHLKFVKFNNKIYWVPFGW